ncbi:MaoC/PaaZ C-terminal domain-containing protein [Rhodococcus pyridinivorans]|uniref:MaoC/PaaZ C-terminal domain-containing protein n=1 Tax=Rhodococcus pyridinivorans TaxID=103816 RepID=UPI00343E3272
MSDIVTDNSRRTAYFEDLQVGERHVTASRTVTETDVVNFAGLSGDYNRLHVDREFSANTSFGERVAHGLLVLAIASGLSTRLSISEALQENIMGLLDLQCRWPGPTRFGDTIHVVLTITDLTPTRSGGRGVVTMTRDVVNQRGETVMASTWKLLIRSKTAAQPAE